MRHRRHHFGHRRSRTGCLGGCVSLALILAIMGVVVTLSSVGACAGLLGAPSARHGRN